MNEMYIFLERRNLIYCIPLYAWYKNDLIEDIDTIFKIKNV